MLKPHLDSRVSALVAIAKAQAEGQPVFHVTQDNLSEVMGEINISQASREDIQRAVSQFGYEAIVHETPITVPGWRGSGYILTDPATGAGSYMIDGGKNGGAIFFVGFLFGLSLMLLMISVVLVPIAGPGALIVLGLGIVWISQFLAFLTALGLEGDADKVDCFVGGFMWGVGVGLGAFGLTTGAGLGAFIVGTLLSAFGQVSEPPGISSCLQVEA